MSKFKEEIWLYIDERVMRLDEYDIENIFDISVDFAVLDQIDDMKVLKFEVREESVEGILQVVVLIDGYEYMQGQNIYKDSGMMVLGIGFNFDMEENEYANIELEYLY